MIIYMIKNIINNKVYIGQTVKTLEHRKKQHIGRALSGQNTKLYNAMRKYGISNFLFSEIDRADNLENLNYLESFYIVKYDSVRNGYNMGYGGDNNVMFSDEVKEKHDKTMRSDDVRRKISHSMKAYRKNNPFTDEHRNKISESMKGNRNFANHKLSENHQAAIIKSISKPVMCLDPVSMQVINYFSSCKDASVWLNGSYNSTTYKSDVSKIKKSCQSDVLYKGYLWRYK